MAGNSARVVIVGVGAVGATFAYTLMQSGLAEEIVLIDKDRERAEGEAMDLNHGQFFVPPVEIRAGDYTACKGAALVVITAGAAQQPGQSRTDLVQRNSRICRSVASNILEQTDSAVLLMVTNPVEALTWDVLRHSGLPPARVFGSGTVLDSARFRFLLSEHCDVDPRNVHAYILGEHGDSEMAAWSMCHMAGLQIDRFCALCGRCESATQRERIVEQVRDSAYHIIESKGFTSYGIGQALLRIAGAVLRDERSVLTVSTLVQDYVGIQNVCLSLPCIVGREGIVRRLLPQLPQQEHRQLRASADQIRQTQNSIAD